MNTSNYTDFQFTDMNRSLFSELSPAKCLNLSELHLAISYFLDLCDGETRLTLPAYSTLFSFALSQIATDTIQGLSISRIYKELSYFLVDIYITTK